MAISTYPELKASIANWLAKDNLTATIPDFIVLAEARIKTDLRALDMQTAAELVVDSQRVTVPSDELEAVRFYLDGDPKTLLDYVTPEFLFSSRGGSEAGIPTMFTKEGSEYVFAPIPDNTYTGKLLYFAEVPPLTDLKQTNWLLTKFPNVYLYASLLEAKAFLMDDARIAIWEAAYSSAIFAINKQSKNREYSGSTLEMRKS